VTAIGGNGGNGCLSYRQENYGSKLPDGGSGGKGGSVFFQASNRLSNLYELRRAHFKGNHGKHGKGQQRHGMDGRDIRFSVPVGTEVHKIKTKMVGDSFVEEKTKIADLD
jgi:GTPase